MSALRTEHASLPGIPASQGVVGGHPLDGRGDLVRDSWVPGYRGQIGAEVGEPEFCGDKGIKLRPWSGFSSGSFGEPATGRLDCPSHGSCPRRVHRASPRQSGNAADSEQRACSAESQVAMRWDEVPRGVPPRRISLAQVRGSGREDCHGRSTEFRRVGVVTRFCNPALILRGLAVRFSPQPSGAQRAVKQGFVLLGPTRGSWGKMPDDESGARYPTPSSMRDNG